MFGIWWLSHMYLNGVLKLLGGCLGGVWSVSERCLKGVWKVWDVQMAFYMSSKARTG